MRLFNELFFFIELFFIYFSSLVTLMNYLHQLLMTDGPKELLFAFTRIPAREKALSLLTLVAGIQNIFLASSARLGEAALWFFQNWSMSKLYTSPFGITVRKYLWIFSSTTLSICFKLDDSFISYACFSMRVERRDGGFDVYEW